MSSLSDNRKRWALLIQRISRICNRTQNAEDLLQSAFLKMEEYKAHTEVRNEQAFLVRAATNIWIDERRKQGRETALATAQAYWEIEDTSPLQDEVLASRERYKRVREGLERIPPRCRQVFLLHRLEGMKYREIAQTLGISQSAVEKHIARAQQFLHDYVYER